jgi:glycosyltransferase involved in cell wall biosynthesis
VGSGRHFLSGISYYTHELALALSERSQIAVILMRQLIPTRFYPGKFRVGNDLSGLTYPGGIHVFDGVDWFWGSRILRCLAFLRSQAPDIVILEWWTGAVLHTYLLLALVARTMGARIVIEFHEVQDVGEQEIPFVSRYVSLIFPLLLRLTSGSVVHSTYDRDALQTRFGRRLGPVATLPHAPYSFPWFAVKPASAVRPSGPTQLLYFGVIRPFKGVDDLINAFGSLSPEDAQQFHLTIVGETWEGCDVSPLVNACPYRELINFVNRYVHDQELNDYLNRADVVVLPYHRSSSSGPLSLAMGFGLPVVVSHVGGLTEAAAGYDGVIFFTPKDVPALRDAILQSQSMRGKRFSSKGGWQQVANEMMEFISSLLPSRLFDK